MFWKNCFFRPHCLRLFDSIFLRSVHYTRKQSGEISQWVAPVSGSYSTSIENTLVTIS